LVETPLVFAMGASSDTSLAFGLGLAPAPSAGGGQPWLIAIVDSRSGVLLNEVLGDPPISQYNPLNRVRNDSWGRLHEPPCCEDLRNSAAHSGAEVPK